MQILFNAVFCPTFNKMTISDFKVVCDETNNTKENIDNKELRVDVTLSLPRIILKAFIPDDPDAEIIYGENNADT